LKIERETAEGRNVFTAYGEGWVEVNGARHRSSLAVGARVIVPDWTAGTIEAVTEAEIAALAGMGPEIVLLGSGASFRFPDPARLAPLHRARIGVEVMDTRAACRTYNILLSEGRKVVAALIVEPGPRA